MKETIGLEPGFNMGILALRIAGKKNGVSKLHGAVSRELFTEVWPDIAANESPITYVTNGIHTCSWLAPNLKKLYNEYLIPYWQDNIQDDNIWKKINTIPDERLWEEHLKRKQKLMELAKKNITERYRRSGYSYDDINEVVSKLNPKALTIGFSRRFATYKRATLIFRDIERLTQILNQANRPVQIIFAGKAHPADIEGQNLIKQIHEISLMPQFKGKIFILENYNIGLARYLVSGVDVWLNNPRRPMEASGTSGEKASVNGVVNFSVLDGWWAEGYDTTNGWSIGTETNYDSYEIQDNSDSDSIYSTLENKIIPAYYNKQNEKGFSKEWLKYMKNSIITTGGKYSTSRMLIDYMEKIYMPLCDLYNNNFKELTNVNDFAKWKKSAKERWNEIKITQEHNIDNVKMNAGDVIEVSCKVELPNFKPENVAVQVYYGQILDTGIVNNICVTEMKKIEDNGENTYTYTAKIKLLTGGNFGYTFRTMPKHKMLLDSENMNLIKWMTK